MAPRFDDEALVLELSVADLLERELAGSLGFANRGGYERMWLGQAIHSRYQGEVEARDPSYRREVGISISLVHKGWEVRLRGRIDGLRREADGALVVEEIKSVRRGAQLSPATRELYESQALVYGWMLARERGEPVRCELVLIEIGTDAVVREALETPFAAVEGRLRRRIAAFLGEHERSRMDADRRREAAGRLTFPYPALRPGQQEILDAVALALEQRDHLLLQAPTGLGKTVATLLPALRYCLERDKRLFVLTAKTLQQEMAVEVLELLNGEEAFRSLRLRAKAKMCANGEVICHEEYCRFAKDYYPKLRTSRLPARLLTAHPTLRPDLIYAAAVDEEICPFEVSLDLSGQVSVVVGDYNYAFAPWVALSDFAAEADLSDTVLVIDEAHNLVERGRSYYSPVLAAVRIRQVAEQLARRSTPLHGELADLCRELAEVVESSVDDTLPTPTGAPPPQAVEAALPEDRLWPLRPAFDAGFVDYLEWQRENKAFRAEDPFVSLYFDLLKFLSVMMLLDDAFSTCAARTEEGPELQILCKDPSRFLGQVIGRTHSTIGLSATLSPPEFYRDLLGFDPARCADLALPNPFPEENRRVVVDTTVDTTWRQRERHYARIAEGLSALAAAVPGNCLVLFPSYRFLAAVAERLEVPGRQVLIQRRSDSDAARLALLDALRGALFGDVVLLAVAGGVFAEGVDYPGDTLSAVAVVGPCLPTVSLERQLLRGYYDERYERGFEYAYVVPGMTRVVQAAGRLLRSAEDRGVIALFGRRFLAGPYRRHLPADWIPGDGVEALVGDPGRAAAEFFGRPFPEAARR